ncbi:MAG TPA: hypothetical protein C5S51_01325 [Methanosarcinaceae archaeon]|nr:hypothetical protein [Methanosarcinaceae archaeon]
MRHLILIDLLHVVKCDLGPDVVVIIGNASKLMRIATILSKVQGEIISSKFKGEFAVCGECTAIPLIENTVNLSLLCDGARMFGVYRSNDIVFCFPMDAFVKLTEALSEDKIIKALCSSIRTVRRTDVLSHA